MDERLSLRHSIISMFTTSCHLANDSFSSPHWLFWGYLPKGLYLTLLPQPSWGWIYSLLVGTMTGWWMPMVLGGWGTGST
jgi:hypothetical protein